MIQLRKRDIFCIFLIVVAFGFLCCVGNCQMTTVSATVTDSDSTVWTNAQVTLNFIPNPSQPNLNAYNIGGVAITSPTYDSYLKQQTLTDGSGAFSLVALDNNLISPSGSKWQFIIHSNTSSPATTYNAVALTGATEDLSSYLSANAKAPRFTAYQLGAFGYADVEVTPIPLCGGQYFNVNLYGVRIWSGTADGICDEWVTGTGGGGGSVGPGTVNNYAKFTPSTTTIGDAPMTDVNGVNTSTEDLAINSTTQQNVAVLGLTNAAIATAGLPTTYTGLSGPTSGTPSYLVQLPNAAPTEGQTLLVHAPASINGVNQAVAYWGQTGSGVCGTNNIPCLNTPNTWLTGLQLFTSSSVTDVPVAVRGSGGGFEVPGIVQASNTQVAGPFYGCSITLSSPVQAGDAILIKGGPSHGGQTAYDTLGNTFTAIAGTPSNYAAWIAPNAIPGTDTITLNGVAEVSDCIASEYSGVATTSPVDAVAMSQASSGPTLTSFPVGPVVTTESNDLLVSYLYCCNGTYTVPSGYTTVQANTGSKLAYEAAKYEASAGSYSATWSNTVGQSSYSVGLIALKAAGSLLQTADLQQYQIYTGSVLSRINNNGQFSNPLTAGCPTNTPAEGTLGYDDTAHTLCYYNGTAWVHVASGEGIIGSSQQLKITTGICSTGNFAYATCTMSETWGAAFPDTNYVPNCTPAVPTSAGSTSTIHVYVDTLTTSTFKITLQNGDTTSADPTTVPEIDCNATEVGTGPGTVTTFSAGTLSPLFTTSVSNPTTTPSLGFALTNAAQNSVFAGPASGGAGAPSYQTAPIISAANMTSFPTLNQNTTGTAANLSGTPALPNGTSATTQTVGDGTTKLATDAFVLANSGSGSVPIFTHTLSGATPTLAVHSSSIPTTDVNYLPMSANVTSITLPASSDLTDGEILKLTVSQPASGGPYTLPTGTALSPLTAGGGTTLINTVPDGCPAIGTTVSTTVPSELFMVLAYHASLTEYEILGCQTGSPATVQIFPTKLYAQAAQCSGTNAASAWDLPTSSAPTAACQTGTNTQQGVLEYSDGINSQFEFSLPTDWNSAAGISSYIYFTSSSTSGTVIFNIALSCTAPGATDDGAFNSPTAYATVTQSTANVIQKPQASAITLTGCAAGDYAHVKISRATDTAGDTAVKVRGVELDFGRAL